MKTKHQENNLDNLRHSAAHLLAAAVMDLYPGAKRTIGPAIENGFYFDFDFGETKISEEDLIKIEDKMKQILPSWKSFERHELSADEAKNEYPDNEYKHELIDEFSSEGQTLTFYKSGNYWDLCRGGHVDDPSEQLKHFKLLSIAGAYWRGDENNKMLTRIYGTAFPTQKELDDYLQMMEEAKKRDHKKLGKELDLFVFSEVVGKGLPLWTPKGSVIRREIERFIVDEEIKRGYLHVYTPDIANLALYEKSGHYPYYKDSMYEPITIDDERYMLRPMTCPHHFELYLNRPHSYKELPMRIAELAKLYRYEQSGELAGLLRVRSFCLADAHIIAKPDQAKHVINEVIDLIEYISDIFGLKHGPDYRYRLSLGDRKDEKKYFKDDSSWDFAEQVLREVLTERKADFSEAEAEAAFYGPKIDVQMRNVNGKEDTAFTVQYDFVMPKRFNLTYIDESGQEQQPIVIHRSSVGAIERVVGFLIEHFAGAFPVWLSPVQVKVLPITDKVIDYANEIVEKLKSEDIRVEIDDRSETLQSKIRDAQMEKVPYMIILGEKEKDSQEVSVRMRSGENKNNLKLQDFINDLKKNIEHKSLVL